MAEYASRFYKEFSKFEPASDGTISFEDAIKVAAVLGYTPEEKLLDSLKEKYGKSVNFDQFIAIMTPTWENVIKAFRSFDKDGNGFVTTKELTYVLGQVNKELPDDKKMSPEDIQAIIEDANTDNDGIVNYLEFVMLMMTM
eukprot:GILI01037003.1.p2 GENE.GILI01037003.1~~GILI01037003.1.p2  ORF type:complete len:141 (+),score=31.74 GILI01037003.1:39-461(+)